MSADLMEKALRKAFSLGQTYWQQADSESYSQNRKSDDTRDKFDALVAESTRQPQAEPAAQAAPATAQDAALVDWLKREMPPGTVISDPEWWAPRIARAARQQESAR